MSVTFARGFSASGYAAGLKSNGNLDLALVVNEGPEFTAAAVTTPNRFCAAPVEWTRRVAATGRARAVVLNSGGANACTGARGRADTQATAVHVATTLGYDATDILVCSTGLIGSFLPMDRLTAGITEAATGLAPDEAAGMDAAQAIMTTDTVPKLAHMEGDGYRIGGMSKGAGMLNPAMATMLCVITTDAQLTSDDAAAALRAAVAPTFNRMDSDGCQSTNDTVILLASGASGIQPDAADFTTQLTEVCHDLVQQMLADAEGASHTIAVTVTNAASESAAEAAGRTVTSSNLVKAAIYGNDPNWGRILSALGTVDPATCPYVPDQVRVTINGVAVFADGGACPGAADINLTDPQVAIEINVAAGTACATVWTNDLTHDYVTENSAYSS